MYTVRSGDVGSEIRAKVSYTDNDGHHEELYSSYTSRIESSVTGIPTVRGISLALNGKYTNTKSSIIRLGSSFEAFVDDTIELTFHMSKEVKVRDGTDSLDPRRRLPTIKGMRINGVNQEFFWRRTGTSAKLVFSHQVKPGQAGRIVLPTNPIVVVDTLAGETEIPLTNQKIAADFSFSGRTLGTMVEGKERRLHIADACAYESAAEAALHSGDVCSRSNVGELNFEVSILDENGNPGEGSLQEFSVDWRVLYIDAKPTEDFSLTSGTLTFPARARSRTISIPIMDDDDNDSPETLKVGLSIPSILSVGLSDKSDAIGTIYNDDSSTDLGPSPLRASFSDVPSEHDGSSGFTFTLMFEEDVEGLSEERLIDAAFEVSGARVTKAIRQTQGSNERWTIEVDPDGHEAVTVVLPETTDCEAAGAICAADGRMLSNGSRATVVGPPGLSVEDGEVDEAGTDAVVSFAVTLDRAASGTVTVAYTTSDGTATAPADYTHTSGSLTFAVGETAHTVSVPVIRDDVNEGSETLTLTLSNPSGAYLEDATATGTINNDGAIPRAWLARLGRTIVDQVLGAVDARLSAARAPGVEATLGGQTLSIGTGTTKAITPEDEARAEVLTAWLRGEDGEADRAAFSGTPALSERELLMGTSFALTEGGPGEGTVSAWGRGVISRFDGREGELTLDGEVGNLMLGADVTRGRATAGLMLSHARGSGGYRGASEGSIEASLTGLYPYGRYALDDRVSVWGVAGYGEGSLTVEPEGQRALETDMDLVMVSMGVRGVLVKAPPEGGVGLAVKSDAMAVRTTSDAVRTGTGNLAATEADVTRLRLGLEGSRWFGLERGANLTPSVELGIRHDRGDAETGFGADIGAGLAWSDPARGLSAGLRARGLLMHEDGSFSDRGFAGSLAWDPVPDSVRGPSLSIVRTVGAEASGGVEALLAPQTAQALEAATDDGSELARRTLDAKLGYGFALFDGRYTGTPEIGLGLSDAGREVVLGWRLEEASSTGLVLGIDIEGARQESADGAAGHRLGLGFGWRLVGAGAERFEVRIEGLRLEPANEATEHRIGLTLTARW